MGVQTWIRRRPARYMKVLGSKTAGRNYFLKSLGLELLTLLGFGHSVQELPKPVVLTSWKTALSHASIHVIPSLSSIAIITINLRNLYLGRTLPGPILSITISSALLQVAAKAQELLIVGSLASIVVHAIRSELMGSTGVPLGVLGGTYLFSSISYFWSPEFWGSLRSDGRTWKRVRLYGLLVLSGLLAVFVGPSTAVLIIPRDQPWAAGGGAIYIRGSSDELWPEILSDARPEIQSMCASPNATDFAICPSGGYSAMLNLAQTRFPIFNLGQLNINNGSTITEYNSQSLMVPSNVGLVPTISMTGNYRALACETAMIGTRLPEAMILNKLFRDWYEEVMSIPFTAGSSTGEYKWFETFQTQADSQIPAVRVVCSEAQNISATEKEITFPVIPEFGCWSGASAALLYEALNQSVASQARTTWLELPPNFGTVSTGFIFEAPWNPESESRAVVGCSVDARWTNGSVSSEMGATITSGQPDILNRVFSGTTSNTAPEGATANFSEFRPISGPTWRPIKLQQGWLRFLTNSLPDSATESSNNTISMVLQRAGLIDNVEQSQAISADAWNYVSAHGFNRTVTLEWILAHLVADGLSREGSSSILSLEGPPSQWTLLDYEKASDFGHQLLVGNQPLVPPNATPFVQEQAGITIGGLSYQANEITDYLSIMVLLIYVVLAVGHFIYLLVTRRSSSSWNTLTELFALAYVSQPRAMALQNTGAGIKELKTYGQKAVIRVARPHDAPPSDNSHVQLVFVDSEAGEIDLKDLRKSGARSSREFLCSQSARITCENGGDFSAAITMDRVQPDIPYS